MEISESGLFCLGAEPCSPKHLLKICLALLLSNLKLKLECEVRFKSFIFFFCPPNTQTSLVRLLKKKKNPPMVLQLLLKHHYLFMPATTEV